MHLRSNLDMSNITFLDVTLSAGVLTEQGKYPDAVIDVHSNNIIAASQGSGNNLALYLVGSVSTLAGVSAN